MACWMPERTLILATATRMAVELGLASDFDHLVNLSFGRTHAPESYALMKRARTWFGLIILEQILQIDAGVLLGLKITGVRRCRVLLDRPFSTWLDMRLFSQVELNHLLTKINESLTGDEVLETVQHARVDIDIWYSDWKRIMVSSTLSGFELPSLLINLTVQRHWADAVAMCRAIRATGVQNIDLMSPDEKQILVMAKTSLQHHLEVILTEPQYLANLKYAMDFVWAKCAFCFLLLLKLTRLLPENAQHADLLSRGRQLHAALAKVCGYGSSKVYLRLLQLSIEKFEYVENNGGGVQSAADIDAFVPDEFIFEWDFPGLNLFSSQTGWDMLFDQFLLGDALLMGMDI
ncbi:hypothetical protein H2198_001589 [Neophaeococcomyces mojaviensis]|uniref:Uncharacterized protein n=1 Tax=Neophaeococcomyces mojaviensis TaxID=3383035 RepID=A0ACC3AH19_9EURO|nr:hypothetical protein H2198_001589 [Knufia sp. JES_112]